MSHAKPPALTVIGIDAATKPEKTGLARGRIENGKLAVEDVTHGSKMQPVAQTVASWIRGPTLLAIDAPLGWPAPMGPALVGHRAGQFIAFDGNEMFSRFTDRIVHETVRKKPLDIGAERIGSREPPWSHCESWTRSGAAPGSASRSRGCREIPR